MADVAPVLMELLEKFMTSEYRDLYSVAGFAGILALTWTKKNISWSPTHLFKNTRLAWTKLNSEDGDAVIRLLCCTAPFIADVLLVLYHVSIGFNRKPGLDQSVRAYRDMVLAYDTAFRSELESVRAQHDVSKKRVGEALGDLREKIFVDGLLDKESLRTDLSTLTTRMTELETAYCEALDETAKRAVCKALAGPDVLGELKRRMDDVETTCLLTDPEDVDEAIELYKLVLEDESDDRTLC